MARVCFCNKCGKELGVEGYQDWLSVNERLCYGSKYDMEDLELDLCYDCLDTFIDSCKIKPVMDHGEWN